MTNEENKLKSEKTFNVSSSLIGHSFPLRGIILILTESILLATIYQ